MVTDAIGPPGAEGRRGFLAAAVTLPVLLISVAARSQANPGLWFDPAQLPSYSGRLERLVLNPAGEIDRLLYREGAQILFPASEAQEIVEAVRPGDSMTVWGIRARSAPAITMLAWARAQGQRPHFVAQPSWFAPTRRGTQRIALAGVIDRTLLTPQGEGMGVLLQSGDVIRLAPNVHLAVADLLRDGASIAAEGLGQRQAERSAIDAERIGPDPGHLQALPAATPRP